MEWPFTGREGILAHALTLAESGIGLALLGTAGVGKSRVLQELGEQIERTGVTRVRVMAAETTRLIPFAPFVELLPDNPTQDPLALLSQALDALQRRRSQRGLLLEVDDAHHLDSGSLTLLMKAVSGDLVNVNLTARTGESMSPDLVALWTNGVMERIDLEPLDRPSMRAVIEGRLGPIDDALESNIWLLSQGNLLLAHELVEGAVGQAIEMNDDGIWTQSSELARSSRLNDLLNTRLGSLSGAARRAMEVVAVGAPVDLEIVKAAAGPGFGELQELGLIATTRDPLGTELVRPVHPLFGEILCANLHPSRLQMANRDLVRSVLENDRTGDVLRTAVWQLRCGEVLDLEVALAGAEEALIRHDPVLAGDLIRPIWLENDRAALIMARSLSYQQRATEAENILGGRAFSDPGMTAELASVRAQNLAYGLGRVEEARDLLEEALSSVDEIESRSRLLNERAVISAIRGDFVDARYAAESVLAGKVPTDSAVAAAYVTLTLTQAMTGDCDGLDSIIVQAVEASDSAREHLPLAPHQIEIMHTMSMVASGRIPDAIELAEHNASATGSSGSVGPTWLTALCIPLDTAGKHHSSVDAARQALEGLSHVDPFGLEPQVRGILALSLGQQGSPDSGASIEGLILKIAAPRLTAWVDRGRAWSLVTKGDVDQALDILVAAGDHAVAGEHLVWGAPCYHDAVRLARPELVIDRLQSLPKMPGAHLIDNMVAHAAALDSGDPGALENVALRFGGMGAPLLAAETWAQAAAFQAESDLAAATRSEFLSEACLSLCEGSDTPALQRRAGLISSREAQIALAAAAGLTSPEIAVNEYISVRTVDNHLLSVYRKLGLSGRAELSDLVAPATSVG